jgi:hypothetical protein
MTALPWRARASFRVFLQRSDSEHGLISGNQRQKAHHDTVRHHLSYRQCGTGSPLVLVHGGFGDVFTNWELVEPMLFPGRRTRE